MKFPSRLLLVLLTVTFSFANAADRPAADIFESSFEPGQGYQPGWIATQKGWGVDRTMENPNEVDVIQGGVMEMPVPHGSQMLKATAFPALLNLQFSETPLKDFFTFSALMAYEPLNPETVYGSFLLSTDAGKFAGARFGIKLIKGEPAFYCRDGEVDVVIAEGTRADPGIFYRFEADLDIQAQTYIVRVFDHESGNLLGDGTGRFRSEVRSFNNLVIVMAPTVYIDDIWIHSASR